MNDNASAALGAARAGFGGLPQRLVQDGVVDEATMLEAVNTARERKSNVVTHLDLEIVRLVSDKLLAKHRVLPMFRRGKRLFIAIADPTNLHAIDEVRFGTGLGVEAIVVEDDKLQKAIDKQREGATP